MNKILKELIESDSFVSAKTLGIYDIETDQIEYYVTQYDMVSALGPMQWWCTWKAPECNNRRLWLRGSFYVNQARARLYFPACLDTRIPPENRYKIDEWLARHNLDHYDKWDIIVETKGLNPNRLDYALEIPVKHCPYDQIHAIEEIVAELNRTLN